MSSGSIAKTLLLSLWISFLLITVSGYVYSGPIGTTLSVFARFFVPDSFETILLSVVLKLAVETIFSILVGVVPWSVFGAGGMTLVVGFRRV